MQRYLETDRGMVEYTYGKWVQYDEAQAEIARLQAEVERLRKLTLKLSMERHVPAMRVADKMHKQQVQATDDYMALLEKLKTAHNDAIEEAAEDVSDWGELYASRNGSPMMQEILHDIRTLKRPTY